MKRFFLSFLLFSLLLCSSSCSHDEIKNKWKEYQTLIVTSSISEMLPALKPEVNYYPDDGIWIKENTPDSSFTWEGSTLSGSYIWSMYNNLCSFVTDYYQTQSGIEFSYKCDTSDLVSFNFMNKSYFETETLLNDIEDAPAKTEQISDNLAATILGNLAHYSKRISSTTTQEEIDGTTYEITYYYYTYYKEICGYPSSDFCVIRTTSKGHIVSMYKGEIGAFDNATLQIDNSRVQISIAERLNELFEGASCSILETNIKDQVLMITPDGYYCIRSNINLTFSNETNNDSIILCLYTIIKEQ